MSEDNKDKGETPLPSSYIDLPTVYHRDERGQIDYGDYSKDPFHCLFIGHPWTQGSPYGFQLKRFTPEYLEKILSKLKETKNIQTLIDDHIIIGVSAVQGEGCDIEVRKDLPEEEKNDLIDQAIGVLRGLTL